MTPSLDWQAEGLAWPHRAASSFVVAGGLRWHVQRMGLESGPVLLLVHGTGASTHSWRGLMPLLAPHCSVVAMDLPGHAFSDAPRAADLSLPRMAALLAALIHTLNDTLGLQVHAVVGHSAGAAIGAQLVLDGVLAPAALVAINGAFLPFDGLQGLLFPPAARLLAATPLAPAWFARRNWDTAAVRRLMAGTGSSLDDEGLALYGTLLRNTQHAASALGMMARWDLRPLARGLQRLRTPLRLIVGDNDRAVPPDDAYRVCAQLPPGTPSSVDRVRGAGHLVHEERPETVAGLVLAALQLAPMTPAAPDVTAQPVARQDDAAVDQDAPLSLTN